VLKDNHRKASQSARSARRGKLVSSLKAQEVKHRMCQRALESPLKDVEGPRPLDIRARKISGGIETFAHKILAERSRRARHFEVQVTDKLGRDSASVCQVEVKFHFQSLGEIVFSEMQTRPKVTGLVERSKATTFDT
jgi:hypothetical protein